MFALAERFGPLVDLMRRRVLESLVLGVDGDDPSIDGMSHEDLTSVYLVAQEEDAERVLRRQWDWIFEEKLYSWHRDRHAWPRKRTYKVFREWFDVRLVELVFDQADGPVVHDEF